MGHTLNLRQCATLFLVITLPATWAQQEGSDCPFAPLPIELAYPASPLDLAGETHENGKYLFSSLSPHKISLRFTIPTVIRLGVSHIGPLAVRPNIVCMAAGSSVATVNVSTNASHFRDAVVMAQLSPEHHCEVHMAPEPRLGSPWLDCPWVLLEVAMRPSSDLPGPCQCAPGKCEWPAGPPELSGSPLPPTLFTFNVSLTLHPGAVRSYELSLPQLAGFSSEWKVRIETYADFLLHGDIDFTILPRGAPDNASRSATRGLRRNEIILHEFLPSGNYTLLVISSAQLEWNTAGCTELTTYFTAFPLPSGSAFLNPCVEHIPRSLNTPGYYDPETGALSYVEDLRPLPMSNVLHDIEFRPSDDFPVTLLRVYVSPHQSDVDVFLFNGTWERSASPLASSQNGPDSPEGLLYPLQGGQLYTLQLRFINSIIYNTEEYFREGFELCDTFRLQVEALPLDNMSSRDYCTMDSQPSFARLKEALAVGQEYILDAQEYQQHADPALVDQFFEESFGVSVEYNLRIVIERRFVLGDVHAVLVATSMGGDSGDEGVVYSVADRRVVTLEAQLSPGIQYTLFLLNGFAQTEANSDLFTDPQPPPCVRYTFSLELTHGRLPCPSGALVVPSRWRLLGPAPHSFDEELLLPATRAAPISFTLTKPAIFHATTNPPEDKSIGRLMGLRATRGFMEYTVDTGTDAILTALSAGEYTLWLNFSSSGPGACETFQLLMSVMDDEEDIAPGRPPVVPPKCADEDLPPKNLMQNFSLPFEYNREHTYTPGGSGEHYHLNFQINSSLSFRAILRYSFASAHITLDVCGCPDTDTTFSRCTRCGEVASIEIHNGNEIPLRWLAPGRYALKIYEHSVAANFHRLGQRFPCASYQLQIRMEKPSSSPSLRCETGRYMPRTLSRLGIAQPGQPLQFAGRILVDALMRRDATFFTLAEESLLRVQITPDADVDVHVYLYNTAFGSSTTADGAGGLFVRIPAGDWAILLSYHAKDGMFLPRDECLELDVELGAVAFRTLRAFPELKPTLCDTSQYPADLHSSGSVLRHRTALVPYTHTIKFDVAAGTVSEITVDVRTPFLIGGILPLLHGPNGELFTPQTYTNERFLRVPGLAVGSYTLELLDPFALVKDLDGIPLSCVPFTLSLNFTASTLPSGDPTITPVPQHNCPVDELPRRLYSSTIFDWGGGQNPTTGRLSFRGDSFRRPPWMTDVSTHFFLAEPSLVRIYTTNSAGVDLDFTVDSADLATTLAATSWDTESESLVFVSNTSVPSDYLLTIRASTAGGKLPEHSELEDCATKRQRLCFSLAIEIVPLTELAEDLRCPSGSWAWANHLPPSVVDADTSLSIYPYWQYFFSDRDYATYGNNSDFTYTMAIHIPTTPRPGSGLPTHLQLKLRYNLALSTFTVRLRTPTKSEIRGDNEIDMTPGQEFNFGTRLVADGLFPGTYTLIITESATEISHKEAIAAHLSSFCNTFDFELSMWNDATPEIVNVSPLLIEDIDYRRDFSLDVQFSHPVRLPGAWLDLRELGQQVVLVRTSPQIPHEVTADYLSIDRDNQELHFWFSGLKPASTYTLQINSSQFHDFAGRSFGITAALSPAGEYKTLNCDCNGHGSCAPGADQCTCSPPFTGSTCLECIAGYHLAAATCVANEKCSPLSCSGHGTCSDDTGVPVCLCSSGYATRFATGIMCGACGSGYSGYPACNRSSRLDLDTIALLDAHCAETASAWQTNWDGVGYLGIAHSMHIAEWFLVEGADDGVTTVHESSFGIEKPSSFHVHVKAGASLRVESTLKKIDPLTEKETILASGDTTEMAHMLQAQLAEAGSYLFSLRYYPAGGGNGAVGIGSVDNAESGETTCITAFVEADIRPTTEVSDLRTRVANLLSSDSDNLPDWATVFKGIPQPTPPTYRLELRKPMNWSDTKYTFSRCRKMRLAEERFSPVQFEVPRVANHYLEFYAAVAFRFELHDFDLVLHYAEEDKWLHASGDYNIRFISRALSPGNYTLWLLERATSYRPTRYPTAGKEGCGQFLLTLRSRYELEETSTTLLCPGTDFPQVLSSDDIRLFNKDGYLHTRDTFTLPIGSDSRVIPNITTLLDSELRVWAYHSGPGAEIWLEDLKGHRVTSTRTVAGAVLSAFLEAEVTYTLHLKPVALDNAAGEGDAIREHCKQVEVELAIANIAHRVDCPVHDLIRPPAFPDVGLPEGAPFELEYPLAAQARPTVYYISSVPVRYLLLPAVRSTLTVEVSSDFVTADVVPYLVLRDGSTVDFGMRIGSGSLLYTTVEPGQLYYLELRREATSGPACVPYNYAVSLVPSVSLLDADNGTLVSDPEICVDRNSLDASPHEQRTFSHLPVTLNSLRYLGTRRSFHVWSDQWLAPLDFVSPYYHKICFTVEEVSVFRAFVAPHVLDVDFVLYSTKNMSSPCNTDSYSDVVLSRRTLSEEDMFVTLLRPGVRYLLAVIFFRFQPLPRCTRFTMELAIEPAPTVAPKALVCAGGVSVPLPPIAVIQGPAGYRIEEELYFQQRPDRNLDLAFNFSVPLGEWSFFAEVKFPFLTGPLALRLLGQNTGMTGEDIWGTRNVYSYGKSYPDRQILQVARIPFGDGTRNFTLRIFEPTSSVLATERGVNSTALLRCIPYKIKVVVLPLHSTPNHPGLTHMAFPASFHTFSFAGVVSDRLHFRHHFLLPQRRQHQAAIKVHVNTLARVTAVPWSGVAVAAAISGGSQVTQAAFDAGYTFACLLEPGYHELVLKFKPENDGTPFPDVSELATTNIEISLLPTAAVSEMVQPRHGDQGPSLLPTSDVGDLIHEKQIREEHLHLAGADREKELISKWSFRPPRRMRGNPVRLPRISLWAYVEYQAPLSQLYFRLLQSEDEVGEPRAVVSTGEIVLRRNSILLDIELALNTNYDLELRQVPVFSQTVLPIVSTAAAPLPFGIALSVSLASDSNSDECRFQTFPPMPMWGSASRDRLRRAPTLKWGLPLEVTVPLRETQLLTVLINTDVPSTPEISIKIGQSGTAQKLFSLSGNRQWYAAFELPSATNEQVAALSIAFPEATDPALQCPSYDLTTTISPLVAVTSSMACPSSLPEAPILTSLPVVTPLDVRSAVLLVNARLGRTKPVWKTQITVNLTTAAHLLLHVAFPGSTILAVGIEAKNGHKIVDSEAVDRNDNSDLWESSFLTHHRRISQTLGPNSYTFTVSTDLQHTLTTEHDRCVPIGVAVQLIPLAFSVSLIIDVQPPFAWGINAVTEFTIEVSFSEPPSSGNFSQSAALRKIDGPAHLSFPVAFSFTSQTTIEFTFDPQQLLPASKYELAVGPSLPQTIKSRTVSGRVFTVQTKTIYTTLDTTCSGYGNFAPEPARWGQPVYRCTCNDGHFGRECAGCADGVTSCSPVPVPVSIPAAPPVEPAPVSVPPRVPPRPPIVPMPIPQPQPPVPQPLAPIPHPAPQQPQPVPSPLPVTPVPAPQPVLPPEVPAKCLQDSCGWSAALAVPFGNCEIVHTSEYSYTKCNCREGHIGSDCSLCAMGYLANTRTGLCLPEVPCVKKCDETQGYECDLTAGKCQCGDSSKGCKSGSVPPTPGGYSARVALLVTFSVAVIIVAIFGVAWVLRHRSGGFGGIGKYFQLPTRSTNEFAFDDDDEDAL
eukprot:TRINITY_DN10617_c0_g1_i1.p1 TRINITY_DN10617_c0_g1~~TRINITY_DN10617_c0_g1_i1.p1  ORF type:complete len:3620 (+),score=430.87 TRINITY_DN10617_c0_g1_i1:32-10891(+)